MPQQGGERETGDEAADVRPPGDSSSLRRREQLAHPRDELVKNQRPAKKIAGTSKKNGKNRIGITMTSRANGNIK